jgi:23S rRNA (cytosine1962-C5)-methyltransferase
MDTQTICTLITQHWNDYALIDSGEGRKLERYGTVLVDRPEPQALWDCSLPVSEWQKADARFTNTEDPESDTGKWQILNHPPAEWPVSWRNSQNKNLTTICRLMSFRHMGLFPEQMTHWHWVEHQILKSPDPSKLKILNLFGYTGAGSLAAASLGAQITHLDASKKAIQWAKDNQKASKLADNSIRWICDDAKDFVAREIRRGHMYDGIILDPPKFGRGPDGQKWQLEQDLSPFLDDCIALLHPQARFLICTVYALRLSSLSLGLMLTEKMAKKFDKGKVEQGELCIAHERSSNRLLSTSLFARWSCEVHAN